jgi:hypothetical protein
MTKIGLFLFSVNKPRTKSGLMTVILNLFQYLENYKFNFGFLKYSLQIANAAPETTTAIAETTAMFMSFPPVLTMSVFGAGRAEDFGDDATPIVEVTAEVLAEVTELETELDD